MSILPIGRSSEIDPRDIVFSRGTPTPTPPPSGRVRASGKFLWRGDDKFRVRGVTYGPFAPDADGHHFGAPEQVRADFRAIGETLGANTIRTYYAPPAWLLDAAEEAGLHVLVDIPWPKHLCFLEDAQARRHAREAVRDAARRGGRDAVLGYSIVNEVPSSVVRWYGARRVERFLDELADVARQEDPHGLLTFASYPPTECLDPGFADFAMFNVYLQDEAAFRGYLARLQNLVGDRPLILGEFGLDTLRNGEEAQARTLDWHLRAVQEAGIAGTILYSWSDDWFTGGHQIEDWAFGITRRDRSPKPAFETVRRRFVDAPTDLLTLPAPRVSVVVCSYNGGATLRQCLESLRAVRYPDVEVIVVDDGSTDGTPAICADFPEFVTIRQENRGLSAARNVGLDAATGEIVAYTDSDCFADPDWLTYLVLKLQATDAVGVGGPNLTPDDGALASWVAVSPGQPTHVLVDDETAEHIPGCNMAFRADALRAIGGFDPVYRAAGDDVDVCWRLQAAGGRIVFAPAACVWHHRRQDVATYFKQQRGYGNAEGLLRFRHPERFNDRGDARWDGGMYGAGDSGLRWGGPVVYRGVFGSGAFQTVYTRGVSHALMAPSSLEWVVLGGALTALAPVHPAPGILGGLLLLATLAVAGAQAATAPIPGRYDSAAARWAVAGLCLRQPLVRGLARYRSLLRGERAPASAAGPLGLWRASCETTYWGEDWQERVGIVDDVLGALRESGFTVLCDTGWGERDAAVCLGGAARLHLKSVEEDHGGGHAMLRLGWSLRPTLCAWFALCLAAILALWAVRWPLAGGVGVAAVALVLAGCWRRAARAANAALAVVERRAADRGLWRRPWRRRG